MPGTGKRVAEIGSAARRRALAAAVLWSACAVPAGVAMAAPAGGGETIDQALCRLIDTSAKASGLPAGFLTRLIWRESSFRTGVTSRAGAQGVAQFMPGTASERGLADPFDPEQAIPEAGRLLQDHPAPLRQSRPCGRRLQRRPDARRELARGQGRAVRRDAGLRRRDHRRERRELVGARQDARPGRRRGGAGPAVPDRRRPPAPAGAAARGDERRTARAMGRAACRQFLEADRARLVRTGPRRSRGDHRRRPADDHRHPHGRARPAPLLSRPHAGPDPPGRERALRPPARRGRQLRRAEELRWRGGRGAAAMPRR